MKDAKTYRTAGGSTVTWTGEQGRTKGSWRCQGCGDSAYGYQSAANQHAAECRAC